MSEFAPRSVIFSVDGTGFVFGIDWMAGAASRTASLRAAAGAAQTATHVAWRPEVRQLGLAAVSGQKPPSLLNPWRSAATILAQKSTRSMLAAFAFSDASVWVVAADKGRICPDGDRVFATEEEAGLHFRNFLVQRNWASLYAPPHWGIAEAADLDLLALLQRGSAGSTSLAGKLAATMGLIRRPGCPVQPIRATRAMIRQRLLAAAAGAAILALGGTGYWLFLHKKPLPHPTLPAVARLEPYYPDIVPAKDFLHRCLKALPGLLAHAETPGWHISGYACAPEGLKVSQTAASYAKPGSMASYHADATVTDRSAVLARPFDDAPATQPLTLPLSTPDSYHKVFAWLREQLNARVVAQPPVPPARQARPQPYREMVWTMEVDAPPLMWTDELAKLPNLIVQAIDMVPKGNGVSWKIRGTVYVAE